MKVLIQMNKKTPVRLYKTEPLTLEYNKQRVIFIGAVFIFIFALIVFSIGTDSINYLMGAI